VTPAPDAYFRGRRVLVTGAGGFIGSHLTERLVEAGARVRAFVRYQSRGEQGWLDDLAPERAAALEVVRGDLRDPDALARAVEDQEIVFHLGALIAIPYSYLHPHDFVQTNVVGTAHLLDACRSRGVARLVHTSTSEVFGTAKRVPIDESHPRVGQSPYAASKIAADALVESYHRSFGLPAVILRPFNTFGPRQSARAVIPAIASQCLAGRDVELGSTHPTRDLTYVDDTVEGFLRAASAPGVEGQDFNLGTGREISVGELAQLVIEMTGGKSRLVHDAARVRPEQSEVERLCADHRRARDRLGYAPRVRLEEGLARTLRWIEANLSRFRVGQYQT
jgi:dTDP-glucose 4,6-dehydratase